MPQAMVLPLHCASTVKDFQQAVETSIATGGCTASRACLAGACYGALALEDGIPARWVASTKHAAEAIQFAKDVTEHREKLSRM